MGDGFDKQKGHPPPPGRVAGPAQDAPTVGKMTRVQQCYEDGPQLLAQFRDRPHSYLDDLLPPHDPEEVKRLIAERAARDNEDVLVELPLGGWLIGKRKDVEQIARHEQTQIELRTLDGMRSTISGSVAAMIARARGDSAIAVMRKVEAAAAIEGAVMALGQAKQAAANQAPVGKQRDLARGAPLEHQAKRSGEPSTPPADVPASPPEGQRIRLGRPPQQPQTPIGPGTLVPKSQRPPRDRSLVDDLKLRSVDTLRDGSPNPAFDPFTPSFIAGHFKSEQRRTGSDDPRTWRNPKGYAAQHPNGRPYARYGEPQGTRLTWGTVEDNRDLQKPREFGQTPHLPDNPKPLPE